MNDSSARLIHSLWDRILADEAADVQLVETHISWVLLAGEFAYKIKKPVDLGFVDFTTLERRRFFCEEELRLNRRLAPSLYLNVVPITGTADEPQLGGEGEPIEYAVRMRRFPQDALLSHLLERGELLPEHIDQLVRQIARFHVQVEVAGPESPFGTAERVLQPVRENFRHLQQIAVNGPRREQIERLHEWSEREFAGRRADFERRKRDGFVRECHGDMHLGNIVLLDGEITIFDCIEFNESFRWIDVLSEAAFLTMDLEDRGRPDLARRFLNAYLELTGDYEGLVVLPFYLCYRALVRAKVAGIRCGQEEVAEAERERCRAELEGYLDLAETYTRRGRPLLMITHGLSGSGKTTGTQSLVEQLAAVRIRSDVERKRLFEIVPLDHTGSAAAADLYTPDATRRTYQRLEELAAAVVRAGLPVVVDATFLKRTQRDEFRRLAEWLGVPFAILEFRADEETLRQRIASRQQAGRDASDATIEVLAQQLASCEPLSEDERPQTITVDAARSLSEAVARFIGAQ